MAMVGRAGSILYVHGFIRIYSPAGVDWQGNAITEEEIIFNMDKLIIDINSSDIIAQNEKCHIIEIKSGDLKGSKAFIAKKLVRKGLRMIVPDSFEFVVKQQNGSNRKADAYELAECLDPKNHYKLNENSRVDWVITSNPKHPEDDWYSWKLSSDGGVLYTGYDDPFDEYQRLKKLREMREEIKVNLISGSDDEFSKRLRKKLFMLAQIESGEAK